MQPTEIKNQAELHLGKGDIAEVFDLLNKELRGSKYNEQLILLSQQFSDLMKVVNVIDFEEFSKRKSKIALPILELLKEYVNAQPNQSSRQSAASDSVIQIYLSVGTPHNDIQAQYLQRLRNILAGLNIKAETLGSTFWTVKKPLSPIQKRMTEVSGCIVLAMERFYAVEGLYKRGSKDERKVEKAMYPTPWAQIEAAMAYQVGIPVLMLKDKALCGEGMFDPTTHDWFIVEINPEQPEELETGLVHSLLESWAEEVRTFYANKINL
jgi:hypothetical protein